MGSQKGYLSVESLGRRSDLHRLIAENAPFFSLKLRYEGDVLVEAKLSGQLYNGCPAPLTLFLLLEQNNVPDKR